MLSTAAEEQHGNGDDDDDDDVIMDSQLSSALDATLARLLRPAGITPDVLDYSFSWHLLCVLRSIAAVPVDDPARGPATTHMAFISQLEMLGGLSHWAIYVALHLADPLARETVVKELLTRHCPEWEGDDEVTQFLEHSLQVPRAWIAEARALWARHTGDDEGELAELIDADDLLRAHEKLCSVVAPAWLLRADGDALIASKLAGVLAELESRGVEIDALGGAGVWQRGGGLFVSFLMLREVYAELNSRNRSSNRPSDGGDGGVDLPGYSERMAACGELADKLNDAAARLSVESNSGGVSNGSDRHIPLRRAAFAKMAEELARWMLSDAGGGDGAVPGASHAVLVAGLRSLRHGKVAASVQTGAVCLASALAV